MRITAVLILVFLFFGVIYFLKPTLYNPDTFYYFGVKCFSEKGLTTNKSFLANLFFSSIPCNESVWKIVGIVFLGLSIIAMYFFASSFNVNPFLVSLFSFLSPVWALAFLGIEPSSIGLLFILFSLGFYAKGQKIMAIGFLLFSILFWEGALVFFGLFLLLEPLLLLLVVPFFLLNLDKVYYALIYNGANETSFGIGLILLAYLLFGFYKIRNQPFWLVAFAFAVVGFLNAKWVIFAVPFLALNLGIVLNELKLFGYSLKPVIISGLFFMILISGFTLFYFYPSSYEIEAINYSMEKNNSVQNSWGLGNYILGLGGSPSKISGPPTPDYVCDNRLIVSLKPGYEEKLVGFKEKKCFDNVCVYECE